MGEGAGMGAFRVDPRGSNVSRSRLRIRSPFRKKEKEEARRSFIFAYEKEPLEKGLKYEKEPLENGLKEKDDEVKEEEGLLTEEYAAMIEKKEKKMGMVLEETEDEVEKNAKEDVKVDFEEELAGKNTDGEEGDKLELSHQGNDHDDEDELLLDNSKNKSEDFRSEDFGSYAVNHGDHLNIVYEDCLAEENEKGGNNLDDDDEAGSEESSRLSVETAREVAEGVIEDPDQSEGEEGEEVEKREKEEDLEVTGCENQDGGWTRNEEENKEEEISSASDCEVSITTIILTKTVDHDHHHHDHHHESSRKSSLSPSSGCEDALQEVLSKSRDAKSNLNSTDTNLSPKN